MYNFVEKMCIFAVNIVFLCIYDIIFTIPPFIVVLQKNIELFLLPFVFLHTIILRIYSKGEKNDDII